MPVPAVRWDPRDPLDRIVDSFRIQTFLRAVVNAGSAGPRALPDWCDALAAEAAVLSEECSAIDHAGGVNLSIFEVGALCAWIHIGKDAVTCVYGATCAEKYEAIVQALCDLAAL